MTEQLIITRVDPEIQKQYDFFMKLLHEDVYKTMKVPFSIHVDIKIGCEEKNLDKAQEAIKVIQKMLNDNPFRISNTPLKVINPKSSL
jgi:hypothetical protein